jgi:WD40 repeat protein
MKMSKRLSPICFYIIVCICLVSCVSRYQPPPIETPGAVYQPNPAKKEIPMALLDWQYNQDFMLVGGGEQPVFISTAALFEWKTGKLIKLDIPDERWHFMSQGPKNLIAYSIEPGYIVKVYDIENQNTVQIAQGIYPTFSPDGEFVAFVQENDLVIVKLSNPGEEVSRTDLGEKVKSDISSLDWIPNSELIGYSLSNYEEKSKTHKSSIVIVNRITGEKNLIVENDIMSIPAWSPDGHLMAYIYGAPRQDTVLHIIDILNQCHVGSLDLEDIDNPHWSPNGDVLAITHFVRDLYFVDIQKVFGAPYYELECP